MALVNPQIAMSYRPTTEYQPRNALAEYAQVQQIMGARTQQETAQMQQEALRVQMAKARRDEQAFDSWIQGIVEKGGPSDPMQATAEMIKTRNPELVSAGLKMRQAYIDAQRDREAMGLPPLSYGSAAAAPKAAAPAAAPLPAPTTYAHGATEYPTGTVFEPGAPNANLAVSTPIAPLKGTVREFAPGGAAGPEMPLAGGTPAPVNALAPAAPAAAPAAPVNQLAAAMSPEEMRARTMLLSSNPGVREAGKAELAKLTAAHVVAPGGSLVVGGKSVFTAPAAAAQPTVLARLQTEMAALPPGDPRRADYAALIRKETSHPSAAQINVNAYTPASETSQAEYMRGARATYDALKNAPATIKNIDAAKKLIPAAAGFMGAGGEPLLKAASFLNNRFGMSINTEGVTNATELRSRLFAGVIENLRKLDAQPTQAQQQALQEAIGNLGTDPSALPRVLDAMVQSVRDKVELYNQDVTGAERRGVKFPYNPQIVLPPPTPPTGGAAAAQQIPTNAAPAAPAQPMYASNPKTGQRIMSVDGGNTWTPAR